MINGRQIRAARGLLKWSGSLLAEKSGLTRETINKIEDEAVQPREGTLRDIFHVFDENGVEFLDNSGVRLKPQSIEVLSGLDGFDRFYEIQYADMLSNGGFIHACGVDEKLFKHYGYRNVDHHLVRMTEMCKSRGIDHCMQILIREGDTNYVADGYAQYRWLSSENFSSTCFYVFNKYLALISFTAVPTPYVILIKSEAFADAYRQQFMKLWDTAIIPS
jgi:transcriptional regulator with XRE-family HTH domain